ncbi:uncharacterized protein [Littorina saxatilis]|uniref:uncharacterized protein isoform X2 n=1 Tax=Littorina saxatilis TaxID=31220 RepID=UPI0038B67930
MSRSAWISLLLVCEVTRRFPGVLGQDTNHTRPTLLKASLNEHKGDSVWEWKIMADEGYLIQVTVRYPNLPAARNGSCNLTDLLFYDGESPDSPLLIGVCDFHGNLKVTSRGQVMLVQLPPAALADKDSGQRWVYFSYTAYPCGDPQVYFRTCKTPTLAGTTQRTRDTSTTTSKQLTTTTTTDITTTTNNAEVNTFVIFVVSTVSALGLVLTAAIFCCLKCYRDYLCCHYQCSMKSFTRT